MSGTFAGPQRIGVVLPADWWVLPLDDETARGRVIADLVETQVAGGPATAGLRRELRVELGAATRRAAARGGWVGALMLGTVDGHPLPATLTGYRTSGSFHDAEQVAQVRDRIEETVAASSGRVDAGAGGFGLVLRAVRERAVGRHGVADLLVLACDYWTDPQDGHGLVHLSFTTPLVTLRDAFCGLFDAITATLHRVDDAPGEEPTGGPAPRT